MAYIPLCGDHTSQHLKLQFGNKMQSLHFENINFNTWNVQTSLQVYKKNGMEVPSIHGSVQLKRNETYEFYFKGKRVLEIYCSAKIYVYNIL